MLHISINESNEELLPLSELTERIIVSPAYYQQKIPGLINECYLRQSATERSLKTTKYLLKGYYFHVYGVWRPYQVQLALYEKIRERL